MYVLFAVLLSPIFIVIAIIERHKKKRKERETRQYFEKLEKERKERAAEIEKRTQERQEKTIKEYADIFLSLPGWETWDSSVHFASGQYDRMERSEGKRIFVEAYDSEYGFAKVMGKSGCCYLTSSKRCSCYDYRKRRLPCKHMYAVAFLLNESIAKETPMRTHSFKPLRGFTVASAGRFTEAKRYGTTIQERIAALGGTYASAVNQTVTLLVCGSGMSDTKMNAAKDLDMEIVSYEALMKMFRRCADAQSIEERGIIQ